MFLQDRRRVGGVEGEEREKERGGRIAQRLELRGGNGGGVKE